MPNVYFEEYEPDPPDKKIPEEDPPLFPESSEPETYGLGTPAKRPEPFTPLPSAIEPLDDELDESSEAVSLNVRDRSKLIEGEDPLVGETLISSLWYPLAGQGLLVLGLYTILFWLIPSIPTTPIPLFGIAMRLVRFVLIFGSCAYGGLLLLETATYTLDRIQAGPRLPEIGLDTLQTGMFALAVVFISAIPLMLINTLPTETEAALLTILFLKMGGICLAMFYVPMGFLALAEIEDVSALNPVYVFRGIGKMPGAYLGLVSAAMFAFAVPFTSLFYLQVHWALRNLIASLLLIYILVVLMRAVSMVYRDRGIVLVESE